MKVLRTATVRTRMYSVTRQLLRDVADKQVQRQRIYSIRPPVYRVDDGIQTRGSTVTDVDKLRLLLPAAETHGSQTEMFVTKVSSTVCLSKVQHSSNELHVRLLAFHAAVCLEHSHTQVIYLFTAGAPTSDND